MLFLISMYKKVWYSNRMRGDLFYSTFLSVQNMVSTKKFPCKRTVWKDNGYFKGIYWCTHEYFENEKYVFVSMQLCFTVSLYVCTKECILFLPKLPLSYSIPQRNIWVKFSLQRKNKLHCVHVENMGMMMMMMVGNSVRLISPGFR